MATATIDLTASTENPELQQQAALTVAAAEQLTITDATSYQRAADTLVTIATVQKRITEWFAPMVEAANKAHKALTGKRKESLDPLDRASSVLRRAMGDWKTEQDRLQRQAEAAAQEALRKAEQERALVEAAALESAGQGALAVAVVEQALSAPPPVVVLPAATPTVEGISYRAVRKFRVLNVGLVRRTFLVVDEARVQKHLDALGDAFKEPGIETWVEQVPVVRGRR